MAEEEKFHLGSWRRRRNFMYIMSGFCMWTISHVMLLPKDTQDTRVNETIIQFAFFTLGGIVGSYVFGATWQDIMFSKHQTEKEKG